MEGLLGKILKFENDLIALRREFHSIPELAFEEYETSKRITKYLKKWGLEVKADDSKTGVVGLLRGVKTGKTIAIRADIDALPIKEETGLNFSSKNEGKMHACGHDGHIAIGLETARILSQYKEKLKGNVKFIFQPAEEIGKGAEFMMEKHVLNNPDVDAIVGLHIWPDLGSGYIGIKHGTIMAAIDKFVIEIIGIGGHGAIPHKSVDPIVMASEIITSFQKIINREIDPLKVAVITVGTINGGTAFNVIPNKVKITGTVRTFDPEIREFIPQRLERITDSITSGGRGRYKFNYIYVVPATINDNNLTEKVIKIIKNTYESNKVIESIRPSMVGEDFSLYQEKIPGTYFFLGTRNEKKGLTHSVHHSKYSIDEDVLKIGVRNFCEIVLGYLNK